MASAALGVLLANATTFRGLATPTFCKCPGNLSLAAIAPPNIADIGGGLIHEASIMPFVNMAVADATRRRYYAFALVACIVTLLVLLLILWSRRH